jgi:hypothetical protein
LRIFWCESLRIQRGDEEMFHNSLYGSMLF